MDSKPTLDDYDEMTPDYYLDTTGYSDTYESGEPFGMERVEAYEDGITRAWREFGKYANRDE